LLSLRKPDDQYAIIESCSEGPYLELFARGRRDGWTSWGAQRMTVISRTGRHARVIRQRVKSPPQIEVIRIL
jgi:N6-adenosine-specific RNA methylase IME4